MSGIIGMDCLACGADGDVDVDKYGNGTCHRCEAKHVMAGGVLHLAKDVSLAVRGDPLAEGSGDFSIGSSVWPGTSKLLEESGELIQVLGKLMAIHGKTEHWSGDLRLKIVEELADVAAAHAFFMEMNLTGEEVLALGERVEKKRLLFRQWQADPKMPRRSSPQGGS